MTIQGARMEGDTLSFDLRNLNDKAHPTRRWSARFTRSGVLLTGDIWYAHVEQAGRRGTVKDAEARAFHFARDLPPMGTPAPAGLAESGRASCRERVCQSV